MTSKLLNRTVAITSINHNPSTFVLMRWADVVSFFHIFLLLLVIVPTNKTAVKHPAPKNNYACGRKTPFKTKARSKACCGETNRSTTSRIPTGARQSTTHQGLQPERNSTPHLKPRNFSNCCCVCGEVCGRFLFSDLFEIVLSVVRLGGYAPIIGVGCMRV